MNKAVKLQRAMIVNSRFSYSLLERHTSLSRSFITGKIKEYEKAEFITPAGLGSKREKVWRLTQAGKRQFDPNASKDPVIKTMTRRYANKRSLDNRPEILLWTAIRELKRFTADELMELKLANKTTTRQYLALLRDAGILKTTILKGRVKRNGYPYQYSLSEKAGEFAPLMGRTFFIFDPNTSEYHTTKMEEFDTREWPGGAVTPSRPEAQ